MTRIIDLDIIKNLPDDNDDFDYNLFISNGEDTNKISLIKQPTTQLGITSLIYTLPVGAPSFNSVFDWGTPQIVDFKQYKGNNTTGVFLAGDVPPAKAHVVIKDTEFPPPIGLAHNVDDLSESFILKRLKITRIGAGRSNLTIKIYLDAIDGKMYQANNYRLEDINNNNVLDALVLYAVDDASGGSGSIQFNLTNINLSNISDNGIAILVVEGNPNEAPIFPPMILKKGLFWIE